MGTAGFSFLLQLTENNNKEPPRDEVNRNNRKKNNHTTLSSAQGTKAAFTPVARKHVSRTSHMYPDTYMSTDTCRQLQVARSVYMLTVSRRHNYYSFVLPSSLYPATDGRQTGNSFVDDTRNMLTATSKYNLFPTTCLCPWCVDAASETLSLVRAQNTLNVKC